MLPTRRINSHSAINWHNSIIAILLICGITLYGIVNYASANVLFDKPEQPFIDRLENGMEIVLIPNHSVKMIAANFIIKVGARDEDWETWGAAHFLEHLLFNGTINRSQEEIYSEFDRLGAYHNAHTGSHYTDFMLLSASKNFLPALSIMTEMIFASTLPRWKFEKERGIVMEEIARSRPEIYRPSLKFNEKLYKNSSLSRNILGSVKSINNLERKRVLEFYKGWYNPNNMVLFVTGDFDADTMITHISDLVKLYPPRDLPARKHLKVPEFSNYADQIFLRVSDKINKKTVIIGQVAPMPEHTDFASILFLRDLLEKRMEKNFPLGITGSADLKFDYDMCILTTEISFPDSLTSQSVIDKFDSVIASMVKKPFKQEAIDLLASNFRADEIFTSEKLHYYGVINSVYWALVSFEEFKAWPDRMERFTPIHLKSITAEWLQTKDRLIMSFQPDKITDDTKEKLESDENTQVHRYDSKGYPLFLARKDRSARVFALHILFRDRWKWDNKYGTGSVDILHRLIMDGKDKYGASVSERLERISGNLKTFDSAYIPYDDYYTSSEYSFLRFETLPEHWEKGISLIFDLMGQISVEPSNVTEARVAMESAYDFSAQNPVKMGRRLLRSSIIPEHAMAASVYGNDNELDLQELDQLKSEFLSLENMIISISSPINPSDLVNKIHASYNKMRFVLSGSTIRPFNEEVTTTPAIAAEKIDSLWLGKSQGAVVMGKIIQTIDHTERLPLIIANAFLNERLAMVLREQQGLAYSLGSRITYRSGDDDSIWALWEISVATRPENLEKVKNGIIIIINELQDMYIQSDTFERLSSSISGRQMMRSMSRIGQAFSIGTNEYYWNNPNLGSNISKEFDRVTEQDVNKAVEEHLRSNDFHIIIVH